jgi:hypothetical protein
MAATSQHQQAKFFRDRLFHLSSVRGSEGFDRNKLFSYAQFTGLFKATKTRFATGVANSVLATKEEAKEP